MGVQDHWEATRAFEQENILPFVRRNENETNQKMSSTASTGNEGCLNKGGKSKNKKRRNIGDTSE